MILERKGLCSFRKLAVVPKMGVRTPGGSGDTERGVARCLPKKLLILVIVLYSILNYFKIILCEAVVLLCCVDACVCIGLIMRVRGCAQHFMPPPGSVGVPSLFHTIMKTNPTF